VAKKKWKSAIIMQVPQGLANAIICKGAEVEILREKGNTAHIRVGGLVVRQFPVHCLSREI
jgi:hypothetical protein